MRSPRECALLGRLGVLARRAKPQGAEQPFAREQVKQSGRGKQEWFEPSSLKPKSGISHAASRQSSRQKKDV